MKKLVQINTVCNTSTGKLMRAIQQKANESGYTTLSIVGRRKVFPDLRSEKIGNGFSFWIHVFINTIFDRQGYGSYFATKKMIYRIQQENPDIIHLHNLHGYYINLPILFRYLSKEFTGKVYWTFHDCWPITGHCAYFTAVQCDKWKNGCSKCPNKKVYPISLFFDASNKNYYDKKRMFTQVDQLTIITPSEWMKELVEDSFLNKYPIKVVNNGIDIKAFSYRKPSSAIYDKYGIDKNKKVILGVANVWDARKGITDFFALAKELTEEYQIVLVGVSAGQIRKMPSNIVGIRRTEDINELVMLYSMAQIFMNPSLEESFSLVTIEAMACGTPVIALNTSAVKELVSEENGVVLGRHETCDYMKAINELEGKKLTRKQVAQTVQKYSVERYAQEIMNLYKENI